MGDPIRTVDDLTDDEVRRLVESASAIIVAEPEDEEEGNFIDDARIVIELGRTSAIEDIAQFQDALIERMMKMMESKG